MKKRFLFIFCLFLSVSVFGENILSLMGFPLGCKNMMVVDNMNDKGYRIHYIANTHALNQYSLWFSPIDESKRENIFNISANIVYFTFKSDEDTLTDISISGTCKKIDDLITELRRTYPKATSEIKKYSNSKDEYILKDVASGYEISFLFNPDCTDIENVGIYLDLKKSL